MIETMRRRIVGATTGLFAHAGSPLEHTLTHEGDPGLFGPGSVTWQVMGDPATFIGGIRALMIQAAHPEVVAGVDQHSRYRDDPLGRLSRTSNYVTATAYGAMPEVESAIEEVRLAHRHVRGRSHRDVPYTAETPRFGAWVHNSLTDSFLAANQAFGRRRLTAEEADRFVAEQAILGRLMSAEPVPTTADALSAWVVEHPAIGPSPGMESAIEFLRQPPLSPLVSVGYRALSVAAVSIIPERIRAILDLEPVVGAHLIGASSIRFLRWALGLSPSWRMALIRAGVEPPPGLFKQQVPFEDVRR